MTPAEHWAGAEPFPVWCARTVAHHDLWESLRTRATVSDSLVARANALGPPWRLLVLTEDWCVDAVSTLPIIARLAELAPDRLALRCLDRGRHPELMDGHLTDGSRSIPKVLGIGPEGTVRATWGPRPAVLQGWVTGEGREMETEQRYKHMRAWYARDRGNSALDELLLALETGGSAP